MEGRSAQTTGRAGQHKLQQGEPVSTEYRESTEYMESRSAQGEPVSTEYRESVFRSATRAQPTSKLYIIQGRSLFSRRYLCRLSVCLSADSRVSHEGWRIVVGATPLWGLMFREFLVPIVMFPLLYSPK